MTKYYSVVSYTTYSAAWYRELHTCPFGE